MQAQCENQTEHTLDVAKATTTKQKKLSHNNKKNTHTHTAERIQITTMQWKRTAATAIITKWQQRWW